MIHQFETIILAEVKFIKENVFIQKFQNSNELFECNFESCM